MGIIVCWKHICGQHIKQQKQCLTFVPRKSHIYYWPSPARANKISAVFFKKINIVAHMFFSLSQLSRINISEHILSGDKDRQSRLSWYPLQSATAPFLLALGEKPAVCHPAERVIACQLLSTEQSPNARAKRRAGRIASDTAHPGNQLLEDLWEVELVHLHWLCLPLLQPLPNTCPPTQLALQPELHLSTDWLHTNPTRRTIFSVYPHKLVELPRLSVHRCHLSRKKRSSVVCLQFPWD